MVEVAFSDLEVYLKGLPENTPENPYNLCVTEITLYDINYESEFSLRQVLYRSERYVSLSFNLASALQQDYSMNYAFNNLPYLCSINLSAFTVPSQDWRQCFQLCSNLKAVYSADCMRRIEIGSAYSERVFSYSGVKLIQVNEEESFYFFTDKSMQEWLFEDTEFPVPSDLVIEFQNWDYKDGVFTVPFSKLNDFLSYVPENSPSTAYKVNITELTAYDCRGWSTPFSGTLQYVLQQNSKKYVDLSETQFPAELTDGECMFFECTNLTKVKLSGLPALWRGSRMFGLCNNLTTVELSELPAFTDGAGMFITCTSLTEVKMSGLPALTDGGGMFQECSSLTEIDCSALTGLIDGSQLFENCTNLASVNISGLTAVTNASYMFSGCKNLTSVDLTGLTAITNASCMFQNCIALERVENWGFSQNCNFRSIFGYCVSLSEIILKSNLAESKWRAVKLHADSASAITVDVYAAITSDGAIGTKLADTVNVPLSTSAETRLPIATDEILYEAAGNITDKDIASFLEKKYPWCLTSSKNIPSDKENFVLWKSEESQFISNLPVKAKELETSRKINGTDFNGSEDITTSKWGTERAIAIASSDGTGPGTAATVDGSNDVTLKLPSTIRANLNGNATTATTASRIPIGHSSATYNDGEIWLV